MRTRPGRLGRLGWGILLGLAVGLCVPPVADAQDPRCPPGFVWQRTSGVGCVQENCSAITNARYSNAYACVCQDRYKSCTKTVDYEAFDRESCGDSCPATILVACVNLDVACPGEESAPGEAVAPLPESTSLPATETPAGGGAEQKTSYAVFTGIFHRLEVFLAGHEVSGPTPIQSAAGGVALTSVLAAWVLVNLGAGFSWQELLHALHVRRWANTPGNRGHVESVTVRADFDAGSVPEVQWMNKESKIPAAGISRRPPPPDVPERPSGPQPLPPVSLTGDSPPSSEPSLPLDVLPGPVDGAPERKIWQQRAGESHLRALSQRANQVDAANWYYEKTNGGGADVAVDVLENVSGPTGSVVKHPYTLARVETGEPGEAKIVGGLTGEDIDKGLGEDEAKVATSEATGWGAGSITSTIHSKIPGLVGYSSMHHNYGSLQVNRVDQAISKEESETVQTETVRNRFATALTRAVQGVFQAEILDRIKGGQNWLIGS